MIQRISPIQTTSILIDGWILQKRLFITQRLSTLSDSDLQVSHRIELKLGNMKSTKGLPLTSFLFHPHCPGCIGKQVGLMELRLFVARFIQTFDAEFAVSLNSSSGRSLSFFTLLIELFPSIDSFFENSLASTQRLSSNLSRTASF